MKVTLYGTRGSTPICDSKSMRFGGNTTSLRIESECIPPGQALITDAGSGFVPLSRQLLNEGIMNIALLFTHYHHDHTQGFLLAPHTYIPKTEIKVWGPEEHNVGPKEIFADIMSAPKFPVEFAKIRHRIKCHPLLHIGIQVLVIHPKAGFHLLDIHRYRDCVYNKKQINLGNGRYDVNECLVIFMHKTTHPEYSVSFRFEEKPTKRKFVFLTDHENTAGVSMDLLQHVKNANLLIQDAQYSESIYKTRTAGFGHGTPEYCAEVMATANVEKLGLTHHDPCATDEDVDNRVQEAIVKATELGVKNAADRIFGCADYSTIVV